MQLKVNVLKAEVSINSSIFPLYTGFLSSEKLKKVANVPNFDKNKPHNKIAADVNVLPVDEWQRPEIPLKIQGITKVYSDSTHDNLMANPVLIGAVQHKFAAGNNVSVLQKTVTASNGEIISIPEMFELTININEDHDRPLWILDGQHRLSGLSKSVQKSEKVPLFFCLITVELHCMTLHF